MDLLEFAKRFGGPLAQAQRIDEYNRVKSSLWDPAENTPILAQLVEDQAYGREPFGPLQVPQDVLDELVKRNG